MAGLPDLKREDILRIVRARGPIIPNELKQVLKAGDTILLGAMLSELATKGLVSISKTKIGGSPFYYDPAKPESLERVAKHLGEKDRRTWELLKRERILSDEEQNALTRVSLRNIKDFAVPLTVRTAQGQTLYWKYYLLSDAEAEQLIKEHLKQHSTERSKQSSKEQPGTQATSDGGVRAKKNEDGARKNHYSCTPQAPMSPQAQQKAPRQNPQIPQRQTMPPRGTPTQRPSKERESKGESEEAQGTLREKHSATQRPRRAAPHSATASTEEQALLEPDDEFYRTVKAYLAKRDILIRAATVVRKNRELDLELSLPTAMGRTTYYCKAKRKKKSTDGDLASAKLQGLSRQLPVLYLSTGEVTKKARNAKEFSGMIIQRLT